MNRMFLAVLLTIILAAKCQGQHADTSAPPDAHMGLVPLPNGATDTTTLNFKDTDLRDIFRVISYQYGVNIFLDNSINKRVTVSLNRVRVVDAVKFLSDQNGLTVVLEAGIFKIQPPPPPPKPEPPPPKIPAVGYDNGLLSVALKDDDVERTVLEIQKKCAKNILLISGTTGTLSGKLMDIDFDIGFTQLMNNNGFAVQKKNGIYIVSRLEYFVGTQGAATQQKSGPYWVSVKDSLVTIDVTNAPLERVLHDMIRQLNTDVVFYNAVTGNVTERATNVSLTRALDMTLRNTNYGYTESEGVYFVGEKSNKALSTTRLLKLKYLTTEPTLAIIPQSVSAQLTIKAMPEQNGFVATGALDAISQLREFLDQVDKPVAQVLIEAIVVDYDLSKGLDLGVEAGVSGTADTTLNSRAGSLVPGINMHLGGDYLNKKFGQIGTINVLGANLNFGTIRLPGDFYFNLKAMESKGLANIRSRPILATLNGHKASLSIGTTQYYLLNTTTPYRDPTQVYLQQSQNFQTIEANVKLEITPYVGSDGLITVEIKPDFKTPVGQFNPNIPPTINQRALSSTLVVKEGETIVLGGLVQDAESETRTQVPILGSIPLLGSLFSSTSTTKHKSELLIYVTPHISYGEAFRSAYTPPVEEK